MRFRATTKSGQRRLEADSVADAKASVVADCSNGEVFALQRVGGRTYFYLIRGRVAYPVNAHVAAVELAMSGAETGSGRP